VHAHLGGLPPVVDLAAERTLAAILINASRDGLVDAAHDLSEGGLAQSLIEGCLRYGVGARVWLTELCERDGVTPFEALFAESTARAIVAVPRSEEVRFVDMCVARGFPHARIGVTDDAPAADAHADHADHAAADAGPVLELQSLFTVPLSELAEAHTGTLPRYFG